ncbi:MAG TPA: DUF3052 domain-containing protein [Terriglobia bacterium]|nr:DUF3052 domain-containing protein [Terriglobia bacterium]
MAQQPIGSAISGYSGRVLVDKLGIKPGSKVVFVNPPENYYTILGALPVGAKVIGVARALKLERAIDFIQCFSKTRENAESRIAALKPCLRPDGTFWISWPKGSSGVETDLNENVIREIGLANGLVDVKVCAVDETWSGLKFVFRLKDRPPPE